MLDFDNFRMERSCITSVPSRNNAVPPGRTLSPGVIGSVPRSTSGPFHRYAKTKKSHDQMVRAVLRQVVNSPAMLSAYLIKPQSPWRPSKMKYISRAIRQITVTNR